MVIITHFFTNLQKKSKLESALFFGGSTFFLESVIIYENSNKTRDSESDVSGRTSCHGVSPSRTIKGVGIFRWRISSLRVPTLLQDFSETFKCLTSIPLVFQSMTIMCCRVAPTIVPSLVARGEFNVYQLELFLSVY